MQEHIKLFTCLLEKRFSDRNYNFPFCHDQKNAFKGKEKGGGVILKNYVKNTQKMKYASQKIGSALQIFSKLFFNHKNNCYLNRM